MSPRKTRRGAKADVANVTLSETISISKENSPPPSQPMMRTRRQLSKTISQDSEADQSLDINKSQRKTNQQTPLGQSTRSRRKATENVADDSTSVFDATLSTNKRTKRAKDKGVLSQQTILQHDTPSNEPQMEKSRTTRGSKRLLKKEDSKSEDEAKENTKGKRSNKNSSLIENDQDSMINEADVSISKEDAEVQQASDRVSRLKASASTTSSPRSVTKRRGRYTRKKIQDFTPESSPIIVNLSPHRTTKTPRKSPMNLSSPKSHAEQSLRLTKTPRKLRVVVESPASSDKSIESSINGTPKKSPNHMNTREARILDTSSEINKKRTPKKKSPVKTHSTSPSKEHVRKFTKSPKIVLKTPKTKSSKSKSPRVVASKVKKSPISRRVTKSPIQLRQSQSPIASPNVEEKISSGSKRPSKSQSPKKLMSDENTVKLIDSAINSRSPKIHLSSVTVSPKISMNSTSPVNQTKINESHKSPTVILNKIPTPSSVTPETTKRTSLRKSNLSTDESSKETPIETPSAAKRFSQGGESPRRVKSIVKKRTPITSSGTPLRPIESPENNSAKSNKNTPIESRASRGRINEKAPIISSTPRERIRRSLNLSPGLGMTRDVANTPAIELPVGSSTMFSGLRATRSSKIEDITNPLISEDDESISLRDSRIGEETQMNETFEVAKKTMTDMEEEETKVADGTYELIEPKTPVLRRKAGKRSIAEIDTSIEERMTKRTCRVRFATPSPATADKKTTPREAGRSRSATPGQRINVKRITPGCSDDTIGRTGRKRSNSMTNTSVIKTPVSGIKRRSNSASDTNVISASKTAQNASVNRLSKPRLSVHLSNKKTDIKTPIARKAPNFAQIHERKFAKMESLVDAKKRVEKRHLAMKSQVPTNLSKVNTAVRSKVKASPKTPAPSVPVNGVYNRYGFKLKKNDAVKIMSQKQPPRVSDKKQNENRLLLKGVRTNRRFELIMKARNINQ